MNHNLKISVSKEPRNDSVVSCRTVTVRERLLRFLLGDKQKLTVIIPGDTVSELAITAIKEGGNAHGQNERAGCTHQRDEEYCIRY